MLQDVDGPLALCEGEAGERQLELSGFGAVKSEAEASNQRSVSAPARSAAVSPCSDALDSLTLEELFERDVSIAIALPLLLARRFV
ncbi:hypothetical protein BEP68_01725 [Microbacterium sp. 4-7]|nr:hypothetical protein [Microbacterium sp. 4-7]